ncbi:NADPH:quinone reductase-like Zn-dependent oxidoreductase [Kribbella sp. VKM Ac-2571]|uniref:zinc-binding dehydrogenase n=1 Tax=Kribbella sp. VKM Ac-2571 TaxID=2512222 RepID=UPI00105C627F|nr:zinc-binding dehydrogenase [Kribbella sp. VKM Ac-2571]TDO66493.1 NADPH:quinone reductase-like Zn-dependent oxidoreductase [Kribbella sp. VKM Ac-2571]
MKALVNTPQGLTVRSVADPDPAPDQALIAVRSFSVNRGELDLLAARTEDWRPGQDIAGVVVEPAEDGSGPAAGARVVALAEDSGWAELAAVSTARLAELPDSVDIEPASTLPLAGRAALNTLRIGGSLVGKKVLVTGATGGVGQLQVQLAVLAGGDVTAIGRDDASDLLLKYGARSVVPTVTEADGLFDLITESVGGESLEAAVEKIAPGGTVVVFGASSRRKASVNLYDFIGHEGARLVSYLSYADPSSVSADLRTLVDFVAVGSLQAPVGFQAGWDQVDSALEGLRHRTFRGKAVLTIP